MQLKLFESDVKIAERETINGTAASTSFQDSLSYVTLLFSEWRIYAMEKGSMR